jgi:hypothetical protein
MSGFKRVLAVAAATTSLVLAAPAGASTTRFDGDWNVHLDCPASADGHAEAYAYDFPVKVDGSFLAGEHGTRGQSGWLRLTGLINDDGTASLLAEGLTNLPSYALYNVQQATHYKHLVQATFGDDGHGKGQWITIRTCTFDFRR